MENNAQLKIVPVQPSDDALDTFPTESPVKAGLARFGPTALVIAAIASVIGAIVTGAFWMNARTTAAAAPETGSVVIESDPAGADVLVDGHPHGKTPTTIALVEGQHQLVVQHGARAQHLPLTIRPNTTIVHHVAWPADAPTPDAATATGSIRVVSEPSAATVTIDSVGRGSTPLTIAGLSVGQHDVIVKTGATTQRRTLQVEANTTTSLVITGVEGGTPSGWLAASAGTPLRILEGGKLVGTTESDRIMLPAGEHAFEFTSDTLGFTGTRTINITAGQTASLVVPLPRAAVSLNASPWAQVWVDGQALGATPIGDFTTTIGTHDVIFRHPQYGERRITALVTLKEPARIAMDMTKR